MDNKYRRVKLTAGKQKSLILDAAKKAGSLKRLGLILNVPYSTIKEYSYEKFLFSENLFDRIIKFLGTKKELFNISYLEHNWGRIKGGKKGMLQLKKKYPAKVIQWRKKAIKNSALKRMKKIRNIILDEKFSEFVGVYLGDGTMTRHFIKISGDFRVDMPYFLHLKGLIKDIFGIDASITKDKVHNTLYFTIFSKAVCDFFNFKLNLKPGNKIINKSIIPKNIMKNKPLAIACLRGLIDTDGSISRRGRKGSQFCIQFTSHNKALLNQVNVLGKKIGVFSFFGKDGAGTNKWENIINYFRIVGSSNLRHIVRFYEKFSKNNVIYQKEVIGYYNKDFYRKINLPFKLVS